MKREFLALLASVVFLAGPTQAMAKATRWAAPESAWSLSFADDEWFVVPNRSAADITILRLAPRGFDPAAPRLCNARHYQVTQDAGWEASFEQWAQQKAAEINKENATQVIELPAGRVDRVEHAKVGSTAVADVYVSDVPLNGITFKIRYRVFVVRGAVGPIVVQLDCRASQSLGADVFKSLDSMLNSLRIPA